MQIFLEHGAERMQIKLDQFFEEPDTLSNFQISQLFGYVNANRDIFIEN